MASKRRQKKMNELFLESYIGMDKVCCRRFGVSNGGVTEYITRLIKVKLAPGRDEALPRLVKYRNLRNRIAHESRALESIGDITKSDLKWMDNFKRLLEKQRDPYSNYLKKARVEIRKRKRTRKFMLVLLLLILATVALAAYLYFK
jgi:hypothetical protein